MSVRLYRARRGYFRGYSPCLRSSSWVEQHMRKQSFRKLSSARQKKNQSRAACRPTASRRRQHRRPRLIRPPPRRTRSIRDLIIFTRPRHGSDHNQPQHDRGAARRRQRDGRESTLADARRFAGFRRQRQHPRAQRARQCAIPHQRHHAARRRHRFRHVPRYRLIGNIALITGALPAQYGLRTAGVVDIRTRSDAFNRRHVGVYGGSPARSRRASNTAARSADTEYFVTGAVLREQYRPGKSDPN